MKRYKVEIRTADTHQLCATWYFKTLDEATVYVNDQRFEDFKCGESDDYEYEIKEL